jgi:hypothetical protein
MAPPALDRVFPKQVKLSLLRAKVKKKLPACQTNLEMSGF